MSPRVRRESEPKVCSVKGCRCLAEYYCRDCRRYFCKAHAFHEWVGWLACFHLPFFSVGWVVVERARTSICYASFLTTFGKSWVLRLSSYWSSHWPLHSISFCMWSIYNEKEELICCCLFAHNSFLESERSICVCFGGEISQSHSKEQGTWTKGLRCFLLFSQRKLSKSVCQPVIEIVIGFGIR